MPSGQNPLGRQKPVSANKEIRAFVEGYLASSACQALRSPGREVKERIVELFVRLSYEHKARAPQYLTGAELEDLLKEVLPQYLDVEDAALAHVPALLESFFAHVESDRKLSHAADVRETLKRAAAELKAWVEAVPPAKRLALAKPETIVNTAVKAGRNDPCPCGSGKKYKKCCG